MITDHIAILLHSSLDQARVNRLKPTKPAEFFAQIAFPPSAGADLHALCIAVAPGGQLAGLDVGVHVHSSIAKPIPGVPADWFIVRAKTQYKPQVFDQANNPVEDPNALRNVFYPGRRVRAAVSAFPWAHESGKKGISFNLQGLMDAGPGERLNIGSGIVQNAFAQHANPGATSGSGGNNPFAGSSAAGSATAVTSAQPAQGNNPFAGSGSGAGTTQAPPANNNPFAQ